MFFIRSYPLASDNRQQFLDLVTYLYNDNWYLEITYRNILKSLSLIAKGIMTNILNIEMNTIPSDKKLSFYYIG